MSMPLPLLSANLWHLRKPNWDYGDPTHTYAIVVLNLPQKYLLNK